MLLAIDIGNTNLHIGLHDGSTWAHAWRARTVAQKMGDEYAILIQNFFETAGLASRAISGVVVASVVPRLTGAFADISPRYWHHQALIVGAPGVKPGIRNRADNPHEVGADRLVNTAAAHHLYGSPAIIIDFGTATTFDVLIDGAYEGGAIAPGIGLSHDALVAGAAQLHKVALEPPPSPIGRSTRHAMQSGLFLGYLGLIEGMVARLRAAMASQAQVIATGGLAPVFAQHTQAIDITAPLLTLEGLRLIYALNT